MIELVSHPFTILFVGLAVVIGGIVFARLNAFIALIGAALIVSLMAPGEWGEKMYGRYSRGAEKSAPARH